MKHYFFTSHDKVQVDKALEFIKVAHDGQLYGDEPYWTHPVMVADTLSDITDTPLLAEVIAALLHDVVEDTEYTLEYINENFSPNIADIVELLTKDNTLSYEENIMRIIKSGNVSAMRVKLADNYVNYNGDKSHMSEARRERLLTKYTMSIKMLEAAINTHETKDD